jgi:muramoyltetrapeptide carboxypeptidase
MAMVRSAGHRLVPFPDLLRPVLYLASDDDQRAEQLMEALSSPEYAAVWIARGGYGLTRILDRLDPERILPKPVIGFSDVTALFAALGPHGHGPLVHGPVLHSLPITEPGSVEHLLDLLGGRDVEPLVGETWVEGTAEGPLVGGNLALLAALCGTPWQLDARGCVLVLEEIGEAPYRVDRMLQQLASAGVLEGVVGVALGEFVDCRVPAGATWTLREVLLDHLGRLDVPVVGELPIGHGARNRAFVWGAPGTLAEGALRT